MQRDNLAEYQIRMSGLVFLLEEWVEWHRSDKGVDGYDGQSSVVAPEGYGYSKTVDDMYAEMSSSRSEAVDACINDLPPAQCAAIMRRYGIVAVYRFARDNYAQCLQEAHERLLEVLPKKGVAIPFCKC